MIRYQLQATYQDGTASDIPGADYDSRWRAEERAEWLTRNKPGVYGTVRVVAAPTSPSGGRSSHSPAVPDFPVIDKEVPSGLRAEERARDALRRVARGELHLIDDATYRRIIGGTAGSADPVKPVVADDFAGAPSGSPSADDVGPAKYPAGLKGWLLWAADRLG